MMNEENESANIKAQHPLTPQQDNRIFESIPVQPAPWSTPEVGSPMNKERAINMFRTANQWLYDKLAEGASCACGNCYLCAYNFLAAAPSGATAAPKDDEFEYCPTCGGELDTGWECKKCGRDWWASAVVDEVQRRMDQVVEAAVEWHQAGREGGEWFDAAEKLSAAIESLLELRGKPEFAEPVTTTTAALLNETAMAVAKEVVNELLNVPRFIRNPESTIIEIENKVTAIISKHFPTTAIEAGGNENYLAGVEASCRAICDACAHTDKWGDAVQIEGSTRYWHTKHEQQWPCSATAIRVMLAALRNPQGEGK